MLAGGARARAPLARRHVRPTRRRQNAAFRWRVVERRSDADARRSRAARLVGTRLAPTTLGMDPVAVSIDACADARELADPLDVSAAQRATARMTSSNRAGASAAASIVASTSVHFVAPLAVTVMR